MIKDLPDLYKEVKEIWKGCAGVRDNNGKIEIALETCFGELHWFSYEMAPCVVEGYINAYRKVDGH